ncbi:MAG: glycosyltransferase family 4 protein [Acidobacteriia bacterium]|nr:glycosyltransferase family 4 protein [Terriglobia bacterium]
MPSAPEVEELTIPATGEMTQLQAVRESMHLPTALVLYHYLYPDDVVSAIHFTELSTGLAAKGWRVVASSSNRSCRTERRKFARRSVWSGVEFHRIWRPPLAQASRFGRMVNTLWMIVAWSLLALNRSIRPDVLIVGTDPVLSPLISIVWKRLRPHVKLVHWCFDLYPEAAVADGLLREGSLLVRLFKNLMRSAYRNFNLIVDIGVCMRKRLMQYGFRAAAETIAPWALVELTTPAPIPVAERCELFGDSTLCLLYSGNFGRAHAWEGIPEIAEALHPAGARIVFSVRGNAVVELREALDRARVPIGCVAFAGAEGLIARLSAADIHIVSLRDEWTGTVVPSKFFGALAVGRPVLFVGRADSAISKWITQWEVGWVLDPSRSGKLAGELLQWSQSPEAKLRLFQHCHDVYRREFSREQAIDRWDKVLRALISQRDAPT